MTVAAYASSLNGWFVYEDAVLTDRAWLPRWLVRLSHDLAGESAFVQRSVNLAWHLLNGVLLWFMARRVLSVTASALAVGLFLLHPVQVESVAYLASRPELVAATWILLACLATPRYLWLAGLCAALVITGKEMGVMAWLLVPLWAWLTKQEWSARAGDLWVGITAAVITVFAAAVALQPFAAWMPWTFYGAQVAAMGRLLWLLPEALWNPVALTIDHDWSWVTRFHAGFALAALLVCLAVAWRSRMWRFALLWVVIALAPRLLVPFPDGLHERHLYTPFIALSLALGASLMKESV